MNNCVLSITVETEPQMRFTTDGQQIAEALGNFYSPHHHEKEETPAPGTLKIIAWGERADKLSSLSKGDVCIIEGRLTTYTVDRPEGFKEKRVQMIADRLSLFN